MGLNWWLGNSVQSIRASIRYTKSCLSSVLHELFHLESPVLVIMSDTYAINVNNYCVIVLHEKDKFFFF